MRLTAGVGGDMEKTTGLDKARNACVNAMSKAFRLLAARRI